MPRFLPALLILFAAPAAAFAKAPTLEELPTAKAINALAAKRIAERLKAEAEAKRDLTMDLIKAYAEGRSKITLYGPVVDVLKSEREDHRHRQAAALALRQRFRGVRMDRRIRDLQKKIGLSIVSLLVDKNNDPFVRAWTNDILAEYWPGQASAIRYDPSETSYPKRYRAYREWLKFLKR